MNNLSIRLFGINVSEVKGEQREDGLVSRDILRKWLPIDSIITLVTIKDDKEKYGRCLGNIYVFDEANSRNPISINEQLVAGEYAIKKDY